MNRLLIAALAMALGACGGPRLLMRDVTATEVPAPAEGQARIVFAAPDAYRDVISIVDERGQYLGQLGGRTWFSIDAPPGAHRYYALAGSSSYVVGGTTRAGGTYWVMAETAFPRPLRWVAWSPGCEASGMSRLTQARAIEPDPRADPGGLLARQLGDVPQRILEADRELEAMPDDQRTQRELTPACAPPEAVQPPATEPPAVGAEAPATQPLAP